MFPVNEIEKPIALFRLCYTGNPTLFICATERVIRKPRVLLKRVKTKNVDEEMNICGSGDCCPHHGRGGGGVLATDGNYYQLAIRGTKQVTMVMTSVDASRSSGLTELLTGTLRDC